MQSYLMRVGCEINDADGISFLSGLLEERHEVRSEDDMSHVVLEWSKPCQLLAPEGDRSYQPTSAMWRSTPKPVSW